MERQLLITDSVLRSNKNAAAKRRKQTVSQILREAYQSYCRDRATRAALKQVLKG